MIEVAVGIIVKNQCVFLAKRTADQHQGDLWEFPGGKCEFDEQPLAALSRELIEEVGITLIDATHFETLSHDYGDKNVTLHFFIVESFDGDARGAEGQVTRWASLQELEKYEFPAANKPIVDKLINHYLG